MIRTVAHLNEVLIANLDRQGIISIDGIHLEYIAYIRGDMMYRLYGVTYPIPL
jgi:hypothetical protein